MAQIYRDYVQPFADSISTDVHGNVVAAINPDAAMKIMLAGHMDEIGFMIHYIDEMGFVFFSSIGGNDGAVPVGQRVWLHGRSQIPGVIGQKAMHLMSAEESGKKPLLSDLWIDIGARSKAEAEELVAVGDVITFQHDYQQLAGDRIAARGLDNKAGVFIIAETLRLLRTKFSLNANVGVFAVATVQEEIGSRGAQTAAFQVCPTTGIAVDMEQAVDYPLIRKQEFGQRDLGSGPTISRGANTNPVVYRMLIDAARREDIPYQVTAIPGTAPTDENKMQVNQAGMATGLIGVPMRYMHTPSEVVSTHDLEMCIKLLATYCSDVTELTDFTPSLRDW
ncbi:M20/M25/M40 family metallo-hydrolase [Phyllobacterium ifriqiyense]|uniref:M20/M25/M40 family metallo-hydrolase n=1 Tax=Phyllobacterium ifriqiyense TaxID=314238 RepID=UPI0027D80E85|nr:M20/M25/M40 family metallo-hydrolase [Phyllobacterium ifriqiyense]